MWTLIYKMCTPDIKFDVRIAHQNIIIRFLRHCNDALIEMKYVTWCFVLHIRDLRNTFLYTFACWGVCLIAFWFIVVYVQGSTDTWMDCIGCFCSSWRSSGQMGRQNDLQKERNLDLLWRGLTSCSPMTWSQLFALQLVRREKNWSNLGLMWSWSCMTRLGNCKQSQKVSSASPNFKVFLLVTAQYEGWVFCTLAHKRLGYALKCSSDV